MSLENLFCCPACKSGLKKTKYKNYECKTCSVKYPIVDGIPVFIEGEQKQGTSGKTTSTERRSFWDSGWKKRVEEGDHAELPKMSKKEFINNFKKNFKSLADEKHPIATDVVKYLDVEKTVLNIGCGVGEAPFLTYLGAEKYIGIDFSFNAAKFSYEFIKKLEGSGITAQADAEKLPIKDESIDLIYSNGVLHHTPNTPITFDEVNRVLRRGGVAIIGLYVTYSPHFIIDRIIGTYTRKKLKHEHWFNIGENAWQTEGRVNPWTKTYTKSELINMLKKYGYTEMNFRKASFNWDNALPKIGKRLESTQFGKKSKRSLNSTLGAMWIITLMK